MGKFERWKIGSPKEICLHAKLGDIISLLLIVEDDIASTMLTGEEETIEREREERRWR